MQACLQAGSQARSSSGGNCSSGSAVQQQQQGSAASGGRWQALPRSHLVSGWLRRVLEQVATLLCPAAAGAAGCAAALQAAAASGTHGGVSRPGRLRICRLLVARLPLLRVRCQARRIVLAAGRQVGQGAG